MGPPISVHGSCTSEVKTAEIAMHAPEKIETPRQRVSKADKPENQIKSIIWRKTSFLRKASCLLYVCHRVVGTWNWPPAEAFVYGRRLFTDAYHVNPEYPLRRLACL